MHIWHLAQTGGLLVMGWASFLMTYFSPDPYASEVLSDWLQTFAQFCFFFFQYEVTTEIVLLPSVIIIFHFSTHLCIDLLLLIWIPSFISFSLLFFSPSFFFFSCFLHTCLPPFFYLTSIYEVNCIKTLLGVIRVFPNANGQYGLYFNTCKHFGYLTMCWRINVKFYADSDQKLLSLNAVKKHKAENGR